MFVNYAHDLRAFLEHAHEFPMGSPDIMSLLTETTMISLKGCFLFFVILIFAAIIGPAMQIGLAFSHPKF